MRQLHKIDRWKAHVNQCLLDRLSVIKQLTAAAEEDNASAFVPQADKGRLVLEEAQIELLCREVIIFFCLLRDRVNIYLGLKMMS